MSPLTNRLSGFGEIKTPPFSAAARTEAGFLLRRLQQGETLSFPVQTDGRDWAQCHELRISDGDHAWRLIITSTAMPSSSSISSEENANDAEGTIETAGGG
jgi:hypothetical protein